MIFKRFLFITILVASFTACKKDEPVKKMEEDSTYVKSTKF